MKKVFLFSFPTGEDREEKLKNNRKAPFADITEFVTVAVTKLEDAQVIEDAYANFTRKDIFPEVGDVFLSIDDDWLVSSFRYSSYVGLSSGTIRIKLHKLTEGETEWLLRHTDFDIDSDAEEDTITEDVDDENTVTKEEVPNQINNLRKVILSICKNFMVDEHGCPKEEQIEKIDNWLDQTKASFGWILKALEITGLKGLRDTLKTVMYDLDSPTVKPHTLLEMVKLSYDAVSDEIEFLDGFTDEATLKQVATLKAIIGEDGKEKYKSRNIFEMLTSTILWAVKRIRENLKKWFGIPDDKMPPVLQMICKGIKGVVNAVISVAKFVVKITATAVLFVSATVLKAVSWALGTLVGIVMTIGKTITCGITAVNGVAAKMNDAINEVYEDFKLEDDSEEEQVVIEPYDDNED